LYAFERLRLQVIPVIDLKQNTVVHAKQGLRDNYLPVQSVLSAACDVFSIVEGLLKLYPFRIIYIADIDAITNTGNHFEQIELLSGLYPHVTWWIDAGIRNINARLLYAPQANIRAVFGSENIHHLQDYRAMSYAYESRHVLSLDKLDNAELGAAELHNTGLYWPDDAICMTLNNVGSNAGPDIARLQSLQKLNLARKKPANLFAAGGVRNIEDLLQLKQLGMAGALVASALHNGHIIAQQLLLLAD
jgi:phosphoribosylformimino-5-aminoimidazole carboxamide ribotide isomerase